MKVLRGEYRMIYRLAEEKELTDSKLSEFIGKHEMECNGRMKKLISAYRTEYDIFTQPKKPEWKPDNRIAVNFAKYIVDTMNGFFIGQPIKLIVDDNDESVKSYLEKLDQYNDMDDSNAELSKLCSIYGKAYEMYYVDSVGEIGITYLSPMDAFMIYDDSVLMKERYFVRLYTDSDGILHGSVADSATVKWFVRKGKIEWLDERLHGFGGVPATEYIENDERIGIFEPALSMIDAYNKALSEKANDVDYFADAYLKILGAKLEEEEIKSIRDDRIINFDGDTDRLVVEFMQKPSGDTTQEHLIDRLERLIFQICMVANISDESFGTASGIAMKYKMLAMSNLEKTKERKFASGMNRRYKLIFSNPVSGMKKDAWVKVRPKFTPNFPSNLSEEAQIAKDLDGIISRDTQIGILSIVDNVQAEIDRIDNENEKLKDDAVLNSMFGSVTNGDEQ